MKFLNERLATEREQVERIQEKFHKDFESVSNKLLVDNTSKFNQQSAESLDKLLGPLKESLHEFKSSLETTRKETATHSALLKDQVSRVGSEAANLSKALKGDVKVLGNWGENMLDQILEKSGLQRDIHYRRQQGSRDAEGGLRFLDVIITLPEGGSLVIDSKVSSAVTKIQSMQRMRQRERSIWMGMWMPSAPMCTASGQALPRFAGHQDAGFRADVCAYRSRLFRRRHPGSRPLRGSA